jgi:rhodanese-related sulfurtransferase
VGLTASAGGLNVSVDEALPMLEEGAVLLDVRELVEWSAGHDPAAVHMPMARVPLDHGLLDPAKPVLVICRSGNRSLTGAAQLREAGFSAVSVDGGMGAWQQAGRTVVSDSGDPGTII